MAGFLASGCSSEAEEPAVAVNEPQSEPVELQPQSLDSPSMQFLPREEESEGWRLTTDPSVYPSAFLDQYFAETADVFQRYDLIDLTVGEYETTSGDGFALVEIFRFPDFVQSFGAFSEQRSATATMLELKNLSMRTRGATIVWRGPFVVRVIGEPAGEGSTLEGLAASTVEGMPEAPGLPGAFRFLPTTNRIELSERFHGESVLGQPYLANSFVADFRIGDETVRGLVLPAPSRDAAALILETWRAFFETNGRLLDPVPNLGEDNFTAEEQFMGRTVTFRIDRFVVIFNGFSDRASLVEMAIDSNNRILRVIQDALRATGDSQNRGTRSATQ